MPGICMLAEISKAELNEYCCSLLCPLVVLIKNEQQGLTLTLRMSLKEFFYFTMYALLCISVLVCLSVVKHVVPCYMQKWESTQSP